MIKITVKTQVLILEIHEKVIRIEEHMKSQNSKVFKHEQEIEKLQEDLPSIKIWEKIKSLTIAVLASLVGSLSTYIFMR